MATPTIDSLLSQWEERRRRGENVTAEDLCRDHPELLEALSRAINHRLFGLEVLPTDLRSVVDHAHQAETIEWPGPGGTEDLPDGFDPPKEPGEIARLGPFRIVRLLGAGGMGAVFEAVEAPLGRRVALKVMRPRMAGVETARDRFLREARAAAALESDHIVPIYRVGEDNGIPYLTMPLLHGYTLDERLKTGTRLSNGEMLRIGRQIAEGLAVAHAQGMVHRDVKPANIWLEEGHGRVKILDFGLARLTGDAAHLTREGTVLGTPAYMSPEQASGVGEVGHLSDLFSLGSVLYKMVASRPPFLASSEADLMIAVVHDDPVPPRRFNPDALAGLDDLIMRLLAKDPEARPASAAAVAQTIRVLEQPAPAPVPVSVPVLKIDTGEAAPDSMVLRPPDRVRRRGWPWWWIATASTALLTLVGGAGLVVFPGVREAIFDEGTLVLEEPRAARVSVAVEHGGQTVGVLGFPGGRVLHLRSGTYTLRISDPTGTLRLATDRVVVARGQRQLVRVEGRPTAASASSSERAPVVAWPAPPPDDESLPGLIPHPMPAPGMTHWQIETRRPHNRIAALAWSPDGRSLACAASERLVRIYAPVNFLLVGLLAGHLAPVSSVSWSPDGARIAAAGADGSIRTWEAGGRPDRTWKGHSQTITATVWSPDGRHLASSSRDRTARVWTQGGAPGAVLSGHASAVNAVAWSPDGERIATAGEDATVRIWDADGTPGPVLKGHTGAVFATVWSPDGRQLATAGADGTVRVWDARGTPGPVLARHDAAVLCLAWSPNGAIIASGSADTNIRLVSRTGIPVATLELHEEVDSLAWSPDGKNLAAGGTRGTLRIWDAKGTSGPILPGGGHQVACLAARPDGLRFVLGRWAVPGLRPWGMDTPLGPVLKGHTAGVRALAWSPDGITLASASTDQTIRLWTATGSPGPVLRGHTGPVNAVAWSRDGLRLASASTDGSVRLWAADGSPGPVLEGHETTVDAVAWEPTGDRLASAGADGTVRLWAGDGTPGGVFVRSDTPIGCLAWSPDGNRLAWGDRAGDVRLRDAAGTQTWTLKGHTRAVAAIAWHPAGDRLASAGDETVRLWDAGGRAGPALMVREAGTAVGVAWTADTQGLVAASNDGMLRAWDVPTLATRWIAYQPGPLTVARFSDRGRNTLFTVVAINGLTYLVEQPDGSITLMTHAEFLKGATW